MPQDLSWTFQGKEIVVREGGSERRGTYHLDRYLMVHATIDACVRWREVQATERLPAPLFGNVA